MILVASSALSSPLFAQNQAAPRPPAPVYNGQDIAAVNATIDRFGFDFVTVGAPGNRSWIASERLFPNGTTLNHTNDRGRVDYSYRIMRTEVVQTQYVDFVQAFRPFWLSIANIPGRVESGSPVAPALTGSGISIFGGFDVNHAYDNSAMTISWRNAARYTNWLHNGAPTEQAELSWDTFHTGAYTFTDESFTHTGRGTPITRNADARFWLPGLDEYLKAAYYDPNRYGEGEEGYWPYPNVSESEPWFGPPGEGDWGYDDDAPVSEQLAVGQFPGTVSPWGLLDVVGTASEWVETPHGLLVVDGDVSVIGRVIVGRNFLAGLIDSWSEGGEAQSTNAFRLATIVPTPGGATVCAFGALLAARRRRI
jgi:formylglycine-generating enzyme required for sulfatase activity